VAAAFDDLVGRASNAGGTVRPSGLVTCFAANAASVRTAAMSSTLRRTNSAASRAAAGDRFGRPALKPDVLSLKPAGMARPLPERARGAFRLLADDVRSASLGGRHVGRFLLTPQF
jgi:hypothetical protein